jgi:hypothetical protein
MLQRLAFADEEYELDCQEEENRKIHDVGIGKLKKNIKALQLYVQWYL